MLKEPIFTSWKPQHARLWGNTPVLLQHRLHEHPLFQPAALADLLRDYPRAHYTMLQFGDQGARATWREGELGGMSGTQVFDAIEKARVFVNLRNLPAIDPRYGKLLDDIFGELDERVPGMKTRHRTMGVLISSPLSRTLFHADLPGQTLWQIAGAKRVYVYPRTKPFLAPDEIERIALTGVEYCLPFHDWYDDHAKIVDLEPGQMMSWDLNAPHRVENHDCLNISMTLEYFTDEIRRRHMVTMANGMLRARFGYAPSSEAVAGPAFWAKAAFQRAMRGTPWARTQQKRLKRAPDFRLDPDRPGALIDIKPA